MIILDSSELNASEAITIMDLTRIRDELNDRLSNGVSTAEVDLNLLKQIVDRAIYPFCPDGYITLGGEILVTLDDEKYGYPEYGLLSLDDDKFFVTVISDEATPSWTEDCIDPITTAKFIVRNKTLFKGLLFYHKQKGKKIS